MRVTAHYVYSSGATGSVALKVQTGAGSAGNALKLYVIVPVGGALVMRPLLLHASRRSQSGWHRRVLHIEYAGCDFPEPLQWHEPD